MISTSSCLKTSSLPGVRDLEAPLTLTSPPVPISNSWPPKYALTANLLPTFFWKT